jgi:hypothetical protein
MYSSWAETAWLPVPGRPVICRLVGCSDPAVDDVRHLCAHHVKGQLERTRDVDREYARPGQHQHLEQLYLEGLLAAAG